MGLLGLLHYGRKRSTACIIVLKIFPVTWDSDTSHMVAVTYSGNVLSWEYQSAGKTPMWWQRHKTQKHKCDLYVTLCGTEADMKVMEL